MKVIITLLLVRIENQVIFWYNMIKKINTKKLKGIIKKY